MLFEVLREVLASHRAVSALDLKLQLQQPSRIVAAAVSTSLSTRRRCHRKNPMLWPTDQQLRSVYIAAILTGSGGQLPSTLLASIHPRYFGAAVLMTMYLCSLRMAGS